MYNLNVFIQPLIHSVLFLMKKGKDDRSKAMVVVKFFISFGVCFTLYFIFMLLIV